MCFIANGSADRTPPRPPDKNDFLRVEGGRASLISPSLPFPGSAVRAAHSSGFHGQVDPMQKPFLAADGTSAVDRANDHIGEAMRLRLFRTPGRRPEADN